jgi:ubiquitin-conjugating enzyme E2 G1
MSNSEKARSRVFILNNLKAIQQNNTNDLFSVGLINDDIYRWEVIIFGPKDTPFESGIFKAEMRFPLNYPEEPPTFKFISPMWHPNIDKDGNLCISILHKSGDDDYGYEQLNERWMPVRSVESVIMSVVCLLDSPNCESSANTDAGLQYRENRDEYDKKVRMYAQKSLDDL